MSLKRIVNEPDLWEALVDYINEEKDKYTKILYVATDPVDIYKAQGRVYALNNILHLKERINGPQANRQT